MAAELAGFAESLKIEIEQGATFKVTLTWNDENGTAIDLTAWTARMHIRDTIDTATILHELTTENGGITLGGVLGTIDLLISATDTAAFTFTSGVYDLELINGAEVTRLLKGSVKLSKEVTR